MCKHNHGRQSTRPWQRKDGTWDYGCYPFSPTCCRVTVDDLPPISETVASARVMNKPKWFGLEYWRCHSSQICWWSPCHKNFWTLVDLNAGQVPDHLLNLTAHPKESSIERKLPYVLLFRKVCAVRSMCAIWILVMWVSLLAKCLLACLVQYHSKQLLKVCVSVRLIDSICSGTCVACICDYPPNSKQLFTVVSCTLVARRLVWLWTAVILVLLIPAWRMVVMFVLFTSARRLMWVMIV